MTISRISDNFKESDVELVYHITKASVRRAYSEKGKFTGVSVKEESDQWTFIPAGVEVWYDNKWDLFVTRQPVTESIRGISDL